MQKILLVSAHPDDMEIGMGGTVAGAVLSGAEVLSVVLTDGRRGPNPFSFSEEEMVAIRRKEADNAASVLGVKRVVFCSLPDLKGDNLRRATDELARLISESQPDEIFTLHPDLDRHPTHRLAGEITVRAAAQQRPGATIWAYEVWGLFAHWDRYEDISSTIATKMRAIQEHRSQVAAIPFAEGVMGLNRWRSIFADPSETHAGNGFAEVFVRLGQEPV